MEVSAIGNRGPRVTYSKSVPDTPHKICSVFPKPIYFHNHNGSYTLPECPPGTPYSYVEVLPGLEKYDMGEDKHRVFQSIPSKIVAEDFIGIPNGSTQYTDLGIFVPEGDTPTPTELASARKRLRAFWERKIDEADREYGLRGQARFIDSNARLAVKELGLKREWAESRQPESATQECPACKKPMTVGALIHSVHDHQGCGVRISYDKERRPYPVWEGNKAL